MAILTTFRHRFYKNDGTVNAGGKVYTYDAGTSTPTATYTTSVGDVANSNPIILDSKGEADIWVVGQIKVNVLESDDTQVTGWPVDNIGSGVSNNDAQMRWGGTATGTANALSISPSPSITEYVTGQSFVFKSSASANTAATTISISGLSAIAVQVDGSACVGGEIQASKWYMVVLSSTTAAQLSPIGATGIIVADAAADTTCWPMLATSQTGNQQPRTDSGLTYNSSTNVLTTGEFKANGTAGGLEITTANAEDTYQLNIAGSMTLDTATLSVIPVSTTVTGGASLTTARGLILNISYTPTANANIHNFYNKFTLNTGISPTTIYGHVQIFILGASALGGTITNYLGNQVSFTPHADATTDITTWTSYNAANIANTANCTVTTAYGFRGQMTSGSGRWNCYMDGTADNAFNGNTRFGGTTAPTVAVDITGSLSRGAPVTKTTDFTLASTENWVISNRAATNTVTLPDASTCTGREVTFKTIQAQTLVSASSNVIPLTGGAAGTAILAATAGKWATLVSNGTNWEIMASN